MEFKISSEKMAPARPNSSHCRKRLNRKGSNRRGSNEDLYNLPQAADEALQALPVNPLVS